MLGDYPRGTDTSTRFRMVVNYPNKVPPPGQQVDDIPASRLVYGMRIYDALAEWLKQIACQNRPLSMIPFHILLEHKQLMLMRLRFMEADHHIDPNLQFPECYRAVVNGASALKLVMLRRVARGQTASIATAQAALGSVRDRENEILSQVLENTTGGLPTLTTTDGGPT